MRCDPMNTTKVSESNQWEQKNYPRAKAHWFSDGVISVFNCQLSVTDNNLIIHESFQSTIWTKMAHLSSVSKIWECLSVLFNVSVSYHGKPLIFWFWTVGPILSFPPPLPNISPLVSPVLDQRHSGGERSLLNSPPRQLLQRIPRRLFSQPNGTVPPPGRSQQPVLGWLQKHWGGVGGW